MLEQGIKMEVSTRGFWWVALIFLLVFSISYSRQTSEDINILIHATRDQQFLVHEDPHLLNLVDDEDNNTIKKKYENGRSDATNSSKFNFTIATTPLELKNAELQNKDIKRREEVDKAVNHSFTAEQLEENDDDGANNDSFSACILWMDDNHRLEEWLAYHYYFLKLRYVVMNVDPFSRTSPKAIVDRWNDSEKKYDLNMTIVTMVDSDYIQNFDDEMEKIEIASNSTTDQEYKLGTAKTAYHRLRQREFYKACSAHLVEQNKSWTSYHDTDEFFTIDHEKKIGGEVENITADSIRKMNQPGYFLYKLNSIKRQQPKDSHVNNTGLSCLSINRKRFCANELSKEETNDLFVSPNSNTGAIIPKGFMNSSIDSDTYKDRETIIRRFDTLRFKYLTPGMDGMPKSVIDLSQQNPNLYIQEKWYEKYPNDTWVQRFTGLHQWNTHKPMQHLCIHEEKNRLSEIQKIVNDERFVVNHYLGTFESYSFRNDARQGGLRNFQVYSERAHQTIGEFSHVTRPWLRGFTELVGGPDVATYLLQDAGKYPEGYNITSRIREYNLTYDLSKHKRKRKRKGGK